MSNITESRFFISARQNVTGMEVLPVAENVNPEGQEPENNVPDEHDATGMNLFGRRKIFTAVDEVTAENVVEILRNALTDHLANLQEEEYLYWYRRGVQPILFRKKEVRPEICNKIVVNNADMVVTFKDGYFLTKPVSYVSRINDEQIGEKVRQLNEYLYASGKHHADNDVVDSFHTTGLGVIYVQPNRDERKRKPVSVYSLDPRCAFCIYSLRPGQKPVVGVNMVVSGHDVLFDVYSDSQIFHLTGGYNASLVGDGMKFSISGTALDLVSVESNRIGMIPIIEYQYNRNRMSAYESAIPLMDAINTVESNRTDGVEQAIQQLCIAYNCQFEEGTTANTIRQAGMICLKSMGDNKADFKILESELNQADTQTIIDSLYEQMLEKCGVPSSVRDGGSTSDNVGAVYLRSGWATADTDARNTEDCFKESNARFTEVFLKILRDKGLLEGLEPEDFELCFVRNDQTNMLAKSQTAINLKQLGLSPELVLERSGLSSDPVNDVELSRKYIDMMWTAQPVGKQVGGTEKVYKDGTGGVKSMGGGNE